MISASEQAFDAAVTGADFDLSSAVIHLAALETPTLDPGDCQQQLDQLAQLAARELPGPNDQDGRSAARALCNFFTAQGFRGNAEDYYAPANSHLDAVLRTRLGIPVSLAFLYLYVARDGLSWPLAAVGFPGHFLLRLDHGALLPEKPANQAARPAQTWFIDPFTAQTLTAQDCQQRFADGFGERQPWDAGYLQRLDDAGMLWRMLGNLKQIYRQQSEDEAALRILGLQLRQRPADITTRMERASILAKLDCLGACADDLEQVIARIHSGQYESTPPQPLAIPDVAQLEKTVRTLRQRDRTMH